MHGSSPGRHALDVQCVHSDSTRHDATVAPNAVVLVCIDIVSVIIVVIIIIGVVVVVVVVVGVRCARCQCINANAHSV